MKIFQFFAPKKNLVLLQKFKVLRSDVNWPTEASAAFPAGLGRWGINVRGVAKNV